MLESLRFLFRVGLLLIAASAAQAASPPPAGWLILSGGGEEIAPPDALARFRDLAGGPEATIVFIPNSAGAIIQGSYVVRGRPDKPVLMAQGRERGFGYLALTAINPHVVAAHREDELVTVVDLHPELLGLGIDTGAAAIVRGDALMPLGSARVSIYDNVRHEGRWYYWMTAGSCLSLSTRRVANAPCGF